MPTARATNRASRVAFAIIARVICATTSGPSRCVRLRTGGLIGTRAPAPRGRSAVDAPVADLAHQRLIAATRALVDDHQPRVGRHHDRRTPMSRTRPAPSLGIALTQPPPARAPPGRRAPRRSPPGPPTAHAPRSEARHSHSCSSHPPTSRNTQRLQTSRFVGTTPYVTRTDRRDYFGGSSSNENYRWALLLQLAGVGVPRVEAKLCALTTPTEPSCFALCGKLYLRSRAFPRPRNHDLISDGLAE